MILFKIIFGIVLIMLVFVFTIIAQSSNKSLLKILLTIAAGISLIFGCGMLSSIIDDTEKPITPLDVYRGKTQLVLDYNTDGTYDSIVVWKGGDK